MSFILFVVVLFASFFVGVFGFSQIIGSLQNLKTRGLGPSAITITLWVAILVGSFFLMKKIVPSESTAFFIGMAASFIAVLSQGKIK